MFDGPPAPRRRRALLYSGNILKNGSDSGVSSRARATHSAAGIPRSVDPLRSRAIARKSRSSIWTLRTVDIMVTLLRRTM